MWREKPETVRPMLATTGDAPLVSALFAYEPKYDGIRALVSIEPARGGASVRLWSRLGNDKTNQFPEVADAVRAWSRNLRQPLLLDGEVVALGDGGEPVSFQNLQGRLHLKVAATRRESARGDAAPGDTALIVFDILRDGDADLRTHPLHERRARLDALFSSRRPTPHVRLSEQVAGDGRAMHTQARERGWEGLLAKRLDSTYKSGRRSPDWCKLKLIRTQTCVIGGWTEPRGSRSHLGALVLGVYDDKKQLHYVGHAGSGFSDAELERVWKRLRPLEVKTSPFAETPPVNEVPHWVRPALAAEVKFTEWTSDGLLRHPTYLGMRDDITPAQIRREPDAPATRELARPSPTRRTRKADAPPDPPSRTTAPRKKKTTGDGADAPLDPDSATIAGLLQQLDDIEGRSGNGALSLPGGNRLNVTNLGKIFWPGLSRSRPGRSGGLTKGDLIRHYVRVAPFILPVVADRALVMKRYPNGVDGMSFYQHKAPEPLPAGVRVATIVHDGEPRQYLVGGSLTTLLYMAQLAAISQDPWFSRVGTDTVDHVAIDLDPPDGIPFSHVRDVALWVHEALEALETPGFAKTSGASGLHIYIPLAPGTSYEAGLLLCQIVATMVTGRHPKAATTERKVAARGKRIYVDCLQNIFGKTLASAYSARASGFAGVSTPVTWAEIEEGVSPQDFTVTSIAARLDEVGDLWAPLRRSPGADLRAIVARSASK